jgi:hypothetical protein
MCRVLRLRISLSVRVMPEPYRRAGVTALMPEVSDTEMATLRFMVGEPLRFLRLLSLGGFAPGFAVRSRRQQRVLS